MLDNRNGGGRAGGARATGVVHPKTIKTRLCPLCVFDVGKNKPREDSVVYPRSEGSELTQVRSSLCERTHDAAAASAGQPSLSKSSSRPQCSGIQCTLIAEIAHRGPLISLGATFRLSNESCPRSADPLRYAKSAAEQSVLAPLFHEGNVAAHQRHALVLLYRYVHAYICVCVPIHTDTRTHLHSGNVAAQRRHALVLPTHAQM